MKARCIHSDVCILLDEIDKDCYDTYRDGTPHDCEYYLSSDFHNDREKVLDVLDVLDKLIVHFKDFEDRKSFRYSASDIIGYLDNFKKLEELRQAGE